jgi:hypothetical protein
MKKQKRDLTGLALFSMAKDKYNLSDGYVTELKEWLIKQGYKEDNIDNWLWQSICENNENYDILIKHLDKNKR